jgi:hypothetical protein
VIAGYRPAVWDVPSRIAGHVATWRRKFRCPYCDAIGGAQQVRMTLDPSTWKPTGYRVERVELPYFIRELDNLANGLRLFGYPNRTHTRGRSEHSLIHRMLPVLEAVGDQARAARRSPSRVRQMGKGLSLALSGDVAAAPFVMSCANLRCRRRYLVESAPTAEIMAVTRDNR